MEEQKQEVAVEPKPELDLVSKVAGFKDDTKVETQSVEPDKFNTNDLQAEIDKITDPNLKTQMEGLKKSLQRGYNDKFQTIAETRKELEKQMTESNLWTPEKINRLLNDQNFVTAAQSVMQSQNPPNSGKSDDEWSTLTDGEKSTIVALQKKIEILELKNQQSTNSQQDDLLKSKYANYDAQVVSKLKDDLINGRMQATNEHLWKVVDYESAIDRAYKLGRKEEQNVKMEKTSAFSYTPDSVNATQDTKLSAEGQATLTQLYEHNKKINDDSNLRK